MRIRHILRTISPVWLFLLLFLVLPLRAMADPAARNLDTYSVIGRPTISAAFIDRILATNSSPAAGTGQSLYAGGIKYNIDPVYALAFFLHESSFGTAGIARYTHSLGNLRCIPDATCYNGFASFSSWEDGYDAWYNLISTLYISTWNLVTVDQIIPRYAPAADNNNESAYISAVKTQVDLWRSQQGSTPASNNTQQTPVATATPTRGAATPTATPPSTTMMTIAPDSYRVLGKPTISAAFIEEMFKSYHSPAVGKGQVFYDIGVKYGIDPVFALAFFLRDSIFGTVGLARVTNSLGRISLPADAECRCQMRSGYRSYANWEDSFTDWYRVVRTHYIDQQGLTAVNQVVMALAITREASLVDSSVRVIERRINLWRKQQ